MKVHIRFLVPGLIEAEAPENFPEMSSYQKISWAQEILNPKTDRELLYALAQYEEPETYGWFDGVPVADAVEKEDRQVIVQTKEWETFSSGEGLDVVDQQ